MIVWLSNNSKVGRGIVLSDDASIPIALGEEPIWDDPFIFTEWGELGRWREDEIGAGIRRKAYSAIIVSVPNLFWSVGLRREISRNYSLVKVFPGVLPAPRCVYLPNAILAYGRSELELLQVPQTKAPGVSCSIAVQ